MLGDGEVFKQSSSVTTVDWMQLMIVVLSEWMVAVVLLRKDLNTLSNFLICGSIPPELSREIMRSTRPIDCCDRSKVKVCSVEVADEDGCEVGVVVGDSDGGSELVSRVV